MEYKGYNGGIPNPHTLGEAKISEAVAWRLAQLNDNGYSFTFIADYIERNL